MSVQKRNQHSVETKYKAIKEVDKGVVSKIRIAESFGVTSGTLASWLKSRDEIIGSYEGGLFRTQKRMRKSTHEDVENELHEWFADARSRNIPVTGRRLQQQAQTFAERLGIVGFRCSDGWVARFKKRRGISLKEDACGEVKSSKPREALPEWRQNVLPDLLSSFAPDEIYNADESALFWRLQPSHLPGANLSSDRITLLLCCNMTGSDRLRVLVVGKDPLPRCFRGVNSFLVDYVSNARAWMTREIFADWLETWNRHLKTTGRRIALIIDDAPSHPEMRLSNIQLVVLPSGKASRIQPLELGVTAVVKRKYHNRFVTAALRKSMEERKPLKWTLKNAVDAIAEVWEDDLKAETIHSCFRRCKFSAPVEHCNAVGGEEDEGRVLFEKEDDLPLAELAECLKMSKEDVFTLFAADDREPTCARTAEDEVDDGAKIVKDEANEEDDFGEGGEQETSATQSEALAGLEMARRFLQRQHNAEHCLVLLRTLRRAVEASDTRTS